MSTKRGIEDKDDEGGHIVKKARTGEDEEEMGQIGSATGSEGGWPSGGLKSSPFYYYVDYSRQPDPDCLCLLSPPGRVPNFPAKMHAILSRPELAEVVCWMPHGRAWKILKPREFEICVIPTYFEHAKFSSFIRQANGWGFRRITSGLDRNSYYHPLFLRGLPHLCKEMTRPAVAKKVHVNPDHEPDLYKISEMYPVPEKYQDASIMLLSTLRGGPRARMSVESIMPHRALLQYRGGGSIEPAALLTRHGQDTSFSFQHSLGASPSDMHVAMDISDYTATTSQASLHGFSQDAAAAAAFSGPSMSASQALASANQMAFANCHPFAAGFAAATMAFNEHQFYGVMVAQQQNFGGHQQQQQHQQQEQRPPY